LSVCLIDFFSRTTWPILTTLGTNHPWGEGIDIFANEGWRPSPRGDNSKRVKIYPKKFLKSSSPEPLGQFQPELAEIILGVRGLPSLRGDNSKRVQIH
jgi:hypothetical protein